MRHPVRWIVGFVLVTAAALAPLTGPPPTAATPPYQGFGTTTVGGASGTVYHVTTLADSGPGSLRDAVSAGDRNIVFDVGGDINLANFVFLLGANITIDGVSAPAPGITINNYGLVIRGNKGAHDVIVRGLRVRRSAIDGIQIANTAYNIVVDHVSVQGSGDGNIDITEGSHDVTVSWSILAEPAEPGKNMLIKYNAARVTLHHNVFVSARQRNPQARVDDPGTPATDLVLDMRNNVVWNWLNGSGTHVWYGATANIVNNFFGSPSSTVIARTRAVIVCRGECDNGVAASASRAFVDGNVSWDRRHALVNAENTEPDPFPAAAVDTDAACVGAARAAAEAGVRPLDALDTTYMRTVKTTMCRPL
jgi:pectate lyase-like protein